MGLALLVRHGQSTANVEGVLAGRMEGVGLSEVGAAQVEELAQAFADFAFDTIHVSPLRRTRETAAVALHGRDYLVAPEIVECDYGSWSGRKLAELSGEPLWAELHTTPSTVTFPDGEALAAIANRAVGYVREHAAAAGVHVFVTHADIVMLVANAAVQAPLDSYQRLAVEPASVSAVWVGETDATLVALNVPPSGARALLTRYSTAGSDSV